MLKKYIININYLLNIMKYLTIFNFIIFIITIIDILYNGNKFDPCLNKYRNHRLNTINK